MSSEQPHPQHNSALTYADEPPSERERESETEHVEAFHGAERDGAIFWQFFFRGTQAQARACAQVPKIVGIHCSSGSVEILSGSGQGLETSGIRDST